MSPISRGFRGHRPLVDGARVPPGQHVVDEFPVLSVGTTPHTPLDAWTFGITGAIDEPVSWTWEQLRALPAEAPTVDIHCVTPGQSSTPRGRASSSTYLNDGQRRARTLARWRSAEDPRQLHRAVRTTQLRAHLRAAHGAAHTAAPDRRRYARPRGGDDAGRAAARRRPPMHLAAGALAEARAWPTLAAESADRVAAAQPLVRAVLASADSRLFEHRVTGSVFGALVFGLALSAFLAPPFSGLDILPSLGVVVIGLGVLLRDLLLALLGALLGAIAWPRSLRSGPRRRNGQALALTPEVTPGPAAMQSCP